MTIFVVVGVVGLALTLLSVFVDGIGDSLDFGGAGSGIFSGASIGGLISGIGFGGMLALTFTDRNWVVAVVSGATGVAVAAVAAGWYSWLKGVQGDEKDLAISGIVGSSGTVRGVSREDPTTGTVAVTYLGAARTMQFTSPEPLKSGASVRITALLDPETVRVEAAG
ncbi:MAG: hypothetical protein LBD90_05625 [Bifidobacteriaceae bacterium]|jgi:hypothetical protein|nr:hypothetical protein [Bifidobacteriaceae bacterium]